MEIRDSIVSIHFYAMQWMCVFVEELLVTVNECLFNVQVLFLTRIIVFNGFWEFTCWFDAGRKEPKWSER